MQTTFPTFEPLTANAYTIEFDADEHAKTGEGWLLSNEDGDGVGWYEDEAAATEDRDHEIEYRNEDLREEWLEELREAIKDAIDDADETTLLKLMTLLTK